MAKSKIKWTYPRPQEVEKSSKLSGVAMDSGAINSLSDDKIRAEKFGIFVTDDYMAGYGVLKNSVAMDAGLTGTVTTASTGTPSQFLQAFLPGVIKVLTKVRRADEIAPVQTIGEWHQEEVVVTLIENVGLPKLYSDFAGVPLASFNQAFEKRQIVRFELGALMPKLGDLRAAATGINPQAERRASVVESFEMLRNDIAFNGFNVGTGETYGILNDPGLGAYVTAATSAAADTVWATKTVAERLSDLVTAANAVTVQSGGNVDPDKEPMTLTMPLGYAGFMVESDESFANGMSVRQWMNEVYPNWTVVYAPQFVGADSGENIFYLAADNVSDSGADGGETMPQLVPAKLVTLGTEMKTKGVLEDYTNALAGVFVKRPYAVVRYSGI